MSKPDRILSADIPFERYCFPIFRAVHTKIGLLKVALLSFCSSHSRCTVKIAASAVVLLTTPESVLGVQFVVLMYVKLIIVIMLVPYVTEKFYDICYKCCIFSWFYVIVYLSQSQS